MLHAESVWSQVLLQDSVLFDSTAKRRCVVASHFSASKASCQFLMRAEKRFEHVIFKGLSAGLYLLGISSRSQDVLMPQKLLCCCSCLLVMLPHAMLS